MLVVDRAGVRVAGHKQHLWQDEAALFSTAEPPPDGVVVDGWRLGLGVCFDMSFPEHARAAALGGAHGYLCVSAFAAGTEHRAAVYLAARALENTVFTAFVNPVGGPPDRPCRGGSAVWAPDGRRLAAVARDRGGLLRCDLDPAELARVRDRLPMLEQCRRRWAAPGLSGGAPAGGELAGRLAAGLGGGGQRDHGVDAVPGGRLQGGVAAAGFGELADQ